MSEIEIHQGTTPALSEQMDYARAISTANLLPQAYRGKPADIMLAVGLGQAMGLTPAEALYRIDVIQGKPTASAELIAANVRKAGHKLRVKGDETSCTATIIRADDPDFEFAVTRDVEWAKSMGLHTKENYKKQPGTMLQWRAITAVARLACPEALYGVAYTSDELADQGVTATAQQPAGLAAALSKSDDDTEESTETTEAPSEPTSPPVTQQQLSKLHAMLGKVGLGTEDKRAEALDYYARVTWTHVESSKQLSKVEAGQIIDDLERFEKGEPSVLAEMRAADVPQGEPEGGQ